MANDRDIISLFMRRPAAQLVAASLRSRLHVLQHSPDEHLLADALARLEVALLDQEQQEQTIGLWCLRVIWMPRDKDEDV